MPHEISGDDIMMMVECNYTIANENVFIEILQKEVKSCYERSKKEKKLSCFIYNAVHIKCTFNFHPMNIQCFFSYDAEKTGRFDL